MAGFHRSYELGVSSSIDGDQLGWWIGGWGGFFQVM